MKLVHKADDGTAKPMGDQNIGGSILVGEGDTRLVHLGENCMMNYITMKAGFSNPGHVHEEHEGMGYVLSGAIDMTIEGETFRMTTGSTWYHPMNKWHSTYAVEDSVVIEFHTPLREDVLDLFR